MNFFGHAKLASEQCDQPGFVLGAMLPDLAAMGRARVRGADPGTLAAGLAFHHQTDDAFHRGRSFVGLCSWGLAELSAAGVRRGPARAVGHVGIELLIDGLLSEDRTALDAYRAALDAGPQHLDRVICGGPEDRERLREVIRRLLDAPLPHAYRDPAFVTERLITILARRPRLALSPDEHDPVRRFIAAAQPRVDRDLTSLVNSHP